MNQADNNSVDLTSCDREPIHELGLVQDFGALLALTSDWIVAHASTNTGEIFGTDRVMASGDALTEHVAPEAMETMREAAALARESGFTERRFGLDLFDNHKFFDVAIHCSGRFTVLEAEPHDRDAIRRSSAILRPVMKELGGENTVETLCQKAAEQLKDLLSIDRVMVYRFHPDLSGEVIAEAREGHLDSFLTLRYPKTDIPAQARKLYLENPFRIIADVNAQPVPIEPPQSLDGTKLDLSHSVLRAVSPIHIEYLKNMGVGASLSISIIVDGKLWGLFACHHYSSCRVPYGLRTSAELFSQLFSLQLEILLSNLGNILAERGQQLHDQLISRLASGGDMVDSMRSFGKVVEPVIPHDGASAFIDGVYSSTGRAPNEEEFRAIVGALNTSATSTVIANDCLPSLIPAAQDFADRAVGALIIPVSRRPRDYVVLWRKELSQVVTWAGNPEKPVEYGPNGARLTPRKSFEAWQQSVDGRSVPWKREELALAERVRISLLEVLLRLTDEAMQERKRADQQQQLLIGELNHRVRNILTLIRGLVNQSRADATDIDAFSETITGRVRALAMAHDNITREEWSAAPLHELIRAEGEAYLQQKIDRILIEGEDVEVAPEAYTVIALVIHEMMTNSAKYGALCDSSGRLEIGTSLDEYGDCHISWREAGGPPVKPPTRRGFGTTVIEKSIPHELRGQAEVRYSLSGVEADFLIPARHVETRRKVVRPAETIAEPAETSASSASGNPMRVALVVEDSMIIAMDAEDALRDIGFKEISVAPNVADALKAVERAKPDFALLDFNLGDESSEPVASRLSELGVPYFFATGYGETIEKLSKSAALGTLKKPYSAKDLESAVAKARSLDSGDETLN
ncbi:HWE histidine kinase domain-containing protein [Paraurantiacibacter namhicola]|uniref:histidine kinase n=1 Tax=Paraurantiacibacter namhicola TaxID=645517 RepID=A0A1C7D6L7_9SPHN|nr:HWE histidine kinase domain-containing protein [Paraurantiacibacter namhicola]ANU07109.1 Bacteriophytochrome [Paraurantiacibacter namhicola]